METIEKIDFEFRAVLIGQEIVFNNEVPTDTYKVTLRKAGKSEDFEFHQSIVNSNWSKYPNKMVLKYTDGSIRAIGGYDLEKEKHKGEPPTKYDVMCCLQKYPVETFEDFCGDFGYDEDSRKAYNTYTDIYSEYAKMARLFSESELEQLSEEYQ